MNSRYVYVVIGTMGDLYAFSRAHAAAMHVKRLANMMEEPCGTVSEIERKLLAKRSIRVEVANDNPIRAEQIYLITRQEEES